MPEQETFLELQTPDGASVTIIKTYDQQLAREAFGQMDAEAKDLLWKSLKIETAYDPTDLPTLDEQEARDSLLLDEMTEQGRDIWPNFSYFVVSRRTGRQMEFLYVSPDWPSADEYATTHFRR